MSLNCPSRYFKIEIPEFEGRKTIYTHFFLKIFGIELERPLIRINNDFYHGKWILEKNYVIFNSRNTKTSEIINKPTCFFFQRNEKKTGIKKILVEKNQKTRNLYSSDIIGCKKLRLYRIPMVVKAMNDF